MQECEDQKGPGRLELSERAIWVGHNLTGNSHAAELTICSVNKAFHSRSV